MSHPIGDARRAPITALPLPLFETRSSRLYSVGCWGSSAASGSSTWYFLLLNRLVPHRNKCRFGFAGRNCGETTKDRTPAREQQANRRAHTHGGDRKSAVIGASRKRRLPLCRGLELGGLLTQSIVEVAWPPSRHRWSCVVSYFQTSPSLELRGCLRCGSCSSGVGSTSPSLE